MKTRICVLTVLIFLAILSGVMAASQHYAVTTVYFNIPSDATFSISMPSTYTFQPISGLDYASATATSPTWISFNFSTTPQDHVQPYAAGVSGDSQNGVTKPIFRYLASGNTNIKIYINLTSIPSSIAVGVNGTCQGSCGFQRNAEMNLTQNSELLLVDGLQKNSYFNCTLWGYADKTATAGQSMAMIYHHSTL